MHFGLDGMQDAMVNLGHMNSVVADLQAISAMSVRKFRPISVSLINTTAIRHRLLQCSKIIND